MAIISLFLPVRINDKFPNFIRYFKTLTENLDDISSVEVLVKFDDDQDIAEALKVIEEYKAKGLQIKHVHTPRGAGYQDMSFGYLRLMRLLDENSKLISATSIDMEFKKKGFDTKLIEASKKYEDEIFVIHTTNTFPFAKDLNVPKSVRNLNDSFQHVEAFPVWSRKWIQIVGSFGVNALSDGFTGMIEYFLANEFGIDRRIDISSEKLIEETHGGGFVESGYWQGPRKEAMLSHLNPENIAFVRQAAKNLALNIANSWKKDDYIKYLTESCLNSYDRALLAESQKMLPPQNVNVKNKYKMQRTVSNIALTISIVIIIILFIYKF